MIDGLSTEPVQPVRGVVPVVATATDNRRADTQDPRARWFAKVRDALQSVQPLVGMLEAQGQDAARTGSTRARIGALLAEIEAIRGAPDAPAPDVVDRIEALVRSSGASLAVAEDAAADGDDGPDSDDGADGVATQIAADGAGALSAQGSIDPAAVRVAMR